MRFSGDSAPAFATRARFLLSRTPFCDPACPTGGAHSEPSLERHYVFVQHIGSKAIEYELSLSPWLDEPGSGQLLQMMRHRRLGDGKLLAQPLAADFTTVGDLLENLKPPWIGERLGNSGEPFVINRHRLYR